MRIDAEEQILKEIRDKFKFKVPNSQYDYRVKRGMWDGKKTLLNYKKRELYLGLLPKLKLYLKDSGYEYELIDFPENKIIQDPEEFLRNTKLPFELKDYQKKYFLDCIKYKRLICESPTSSGKSFIMYLLCKYFNKKTLIIVPTVDLIFQLKNNFESYGYEEEIHMIYAGQEKNNDKNITIATYQSLNVEEKFFKKFEIILNDEVHLASCKSLIEILEKCKNSHVKLGFTGTLNNQAYNDHIIEGLFGPVTKHISTEELISQGHASPLKIKNLILQYQQDIKTEDYPSELNYIINHNKRNNFIKKLALSLKGNTVIMFKFIEHGKILYELIKKDVKIPFYYVDGNSTGGDAENRTHVINSIENSKESLSIVSTVFSTGINITSIDNIILVSPSKGRVKLLQTIGRGLRKNVNKNELVVYDIADYFMRKNYTFLHFLERKKIYKKEKFIFQDFILKI